MEIESELIELDTLSAFAAGLAAGDGAPQTLAEAAMAQVVAFAAGRAPDGAESEAIARIAGHAAAAGQG